MMILMAIAICLLAFRLATLEGQLFAERDGLPGRRVGGGTRNTAIEQPEIAKTITVNPPVNGGPGGRSPGGSRLVDDAEKQMV